MGRRHGGSNSRRQWRAGLLSLLALGAEPAWCEPLPSPLTLEQALQHAATGHPDLERARARLHGARAGMDLAESTNAFRAQIDLTPQWVQPSNTSGIELVNDGRARLLISKRLYDFGRMSALNAAARAEMEARESAFRDARQARYLEIQARYFDVLLADLRFAVDSEASSLNFVAFDKSRERHSLGQISDIEILEFEHRYREAFSLRTRSEKRQVQSRQQLAIALNRPDELSADLVMPSLPGNDRDIPDSKPLLDKALQHNPALLSLRREAEAARAQVAAERARRYPVLSAEGEAARYEREFPSRDDLRAGLNLRIPLWQGGEDRAVIGLALARLHEQAARVARAELDMRQSVLDLQQEIESLQVERTAAKVRKAWRELHLDRSRALYELEIRTDLGDALTRMTESQWLAAQVEFRLAQAWSRMEALTGELVQPDSQEPAR